MLRPSMMRAARSVRRPVAVRHFIAMVARSAKDTPSGTATSELREFARVSELPQQDPDATVEVAVSHSDLNYKDGLIVLGRSGVVRSFPIVPGIDFAGTVVRSRSPRFREGDAVALTGNKV